MFVVPFGLQRILTALGNPGDDSRQNAIFYTFVILGANLSFAAKDLVSQDPVVSKPYLKTEWSFKPGILVVATNGLEDNFSAQ